MAVALSELSGVDERRSNRPLSNVLPGTVVNDCDPKQQGKVLVRIPALQEEFWARLSAPGGGSGAGLFYNPRIEDEVLVALSEQEGATVAFIVGGLWSTADTPPISNNPADVQNKRVLRTGLKGAAEAHTVEFDDLEKTITITSSTKQAIVITPDKIQISNDRGDMSVTLDNQSNTVTVKGPNITIDAETNLTLQAQNIQLDGTAITIGASSACKVSGNPISLN